MDAIIPKSQRRLQNLRDCGRVKALESHYHEKFTSDALVLHMGYGRTQLIHLFKQHPRLSPNEYLVRFRIKNIKKDKEMLAHTSKLIAAIASSSQRWHPLSRVVAADIMSERTILAEKSAAGL